MRRPEVTEFLCALARSMGLDRVAALFDCTMGSDVDVPVAEQLLTEAEAEREVGSQQHTTREATGPVGAAETTRSGGGT